LEPNTTDTQPKQPRKSRRRLRRVGYFLAILFLGALWLNGPGLRWLAPKIAKPFLANAGLSGSFRLEGSLTGGLSIHDLSLSGNAEIQHLSIYRATPVYRLRELLNGKLRGLDAQDIHLTIRLLEKPDEESKPPDLSKIFETVRAIRQHVIPLDLRVADLQLTILRDESTVFSLGKSTLTHQPDNPAITLDIGPIAAIETLELEPQKTLITWQENQLSLDRIEPWPKVTIQNLDLDLSETSPGQASAELGLLDAIFDLETTSNLQSATLRLREGLLDLSEVAETFGFEIPAQAQLTSFSLEIDDILPSPLLATGEIQTVLESVTWQDWSVDELVIGSNLGTDTGKIALRTVLHDAPLTLDSTINLIRTELAITPIDATGTLRGENLPALIRGLATRFPSLDPNATLPASSLRSEFSVAFEDSKPSIATASLSITPEERTAASSIEISADWKPNTPIAAALNVDGLILTGSYDPDPQTYSVDLKTIGFRSPRIAPWLAAARIIPPGELTLTASAKASGNLKSATHTGTTNIESAEWIQPDQLPLRATGSLSHDWPGRIQASNLLIQRADQSIRLQALLADNRLELTELLWLNGETEMATADATIPVPNDFSKWREMISKDTRPFTLSVETRELSFATLEPWLPPSAKLDPSAKGKLSIQASGSFAAPQIQASLETRNLRSPSAPQLPPADLKLQLKSNAGTLTLNGEATAPDFAPAILLATIPFRPSAWAENPDAFLKEPLSVKLDLPRLDLSRFTALVPSLRELKGTLISNATVTGTPAKPEIIGNISLEGGAITFNNSSVPAIKEITANIEATLTSIKLKQLSATSSGGTLKASGTLTLDRGKPANIDLQLTGDHLPAIRNESLIVRTNANLRLTGTWQQATLNGTVGLVDSIFYRDIELLPIGAPFNAPSAASLPRIDVTPTTTALPAPFGSWKINVTATTEEPFLIRGNLAAGQVNAALRIGGTFDKPLPDGTVRVEDFRAALPFSTLTARSGTLVFTPANGWDPVIEARAKAEPRPYRVDAYVYGRLSNPQLVLTSNPPMPENEIMTLLATGTTTTQLENPQAASSRALQLLAEEVRRGRVRFSRQLRPLLGLLDNVDFSLAETDPYDGDSYSTATLSITDRWFLSAGMGTAGDTRVLAIWRISFR